jgi:hypothetical protein
VSRTTLHKVIAMGPNQGKPRCQGKCAPHGFLGTAYQCDRVATTDNLTKCGTHSEAATARREQAKDARQRAREQGWRREWRDAETIALLRQEFQGALAAKDKAGDPSPVVTVTLDHERAVAFANYKRT